MNYVMLHGMGQNASSWEKTITFLNDKTDGICPELKDFFDLDECCYDKMYNSFCDYCSSLSQPLDLCGLSLGAVLALNYAVDFPEKIKSLILIAPQYDMPRFLLKLQNVIFKYPALC